MSLTALLSYTYTALNELRSRCTENALPTQVFHQGNRLTVESDGQRHCRILRGGSTPLAQLPGTGDNDRGHLLQTDKQHSVLGHFGSENSHRPGYTPYGHCAASPVDRQSFNGERPEPISGHYLLGSYRAYSPLLMRFTKPDSLSPFGKGGLNAYAYCAGDPVNRIDPTGHSIASFFRGITGITAKRQARLLTQRHNLTLARNERAVQKISRRLAGLGPEDVPHPKGSRDWLEVRDLNRYPPVERYSTYTNPDGSEFHVNRHGDPGIVIGINNRAVSGKDFAYEITELNAYNPEKVKRIHLHVCYSATPGRGLPSVAEAVARITGKPTTGYISVTEVIEAHTVGPNVDSSWFYYTTMPEPSGDKNIGITFLPQAMSNLRRTGSS